MEDDIIMAGVCIGRDHRARQEVKEKFRAQACSFVPPLSGEPTRVPQELQKFLPRSPSVTYLLPTRFHLLKVPSRLSVTTLGTELPMHKSLVTHSNYSTEQASFVYSNCTN
jgi:hypothetical protein